MSKFDELWKNRRWNTEVTSDKEDAEEWFEKGKHSKMDCLRPFKKCCDLKIKDKEYYTIETGCGNELQFAGKSIEDYHAFRNGKIKYCPFCGDLIRKLEI